MKAPDFWTKGGLASLLLAPAGWLWAAGSSLRGWGEKPPFKPEVPVICVGNAVVGGQGKTPVALALAAHLKGAHFLSAGYGGSAQGPLRVDPLFHDYRIVGDEPLELAAAAPCWVAKDRVAGARAAVEAGARCLVMDDGFQDPSLAKTLSFLVVDGAYGFGSERCIPAGPLREPVGRALARTDAVVLIGSDRHNLTRRFGKKPVLNAVLEPETEAHGLAGRAVVAFAGIGRPDKFFQTLEDVGARLAAAFAFPDHHPYHPAEIGALVAEAERLGASLITTAKDYVRIPPHQRYKVTVLPVRLIWKDEAALRAVLSRKLKGGS